MTIVNLDLMRVLVGDRHRLLARLGHDRRARRRPVVRAPKES